MLKQTWVILALKVIYWFKRDLRSRDNRGLLEAYNKGDEIYPVYVFDKQCIERKNTCFSEKQLAFLINVVKSLREKIPLNIFVGYIEDVFDYLLNTTRADALYTSTPLSWTDKLNANKVRELCERYGVRYIEVLDNVLSDPKLPHSTTSFTLFYKSWLKSVETRVVDEPPVRKFKDLNGLNIDELSRTLESRNVWTESIAPSWGLERLRTFKFERYDELRDYPYVDGVSRLSHFITLGALSIREVYNAAYGRSTEFIRQLAWRDYYYTLWFRFPWMRSEELKPYMRGLEWDNDKYFLENFVNGRTGYPIVDAGLKQLKLEGWIHNRVRLIIASFFVKDLCIDWRLGADFFKSNLVDYDEVLNIGNWQWAASVGVDPLPLRVFNPIKQSERYDPYCRYIKKYLPELEGYDCKAIHNPLKYRLKGYYEPIVDHYEAIKRYVDRVKKHIRSRKATN